MPRVTHVKKARHSPGNCSLCSKEIITGEPYYWWQFAFSPKSIRCELHPPKAQDLTRSAFFSALYDIQEEDFAAGDDVSSLESLRDEVVQRLEDLKSETEDKLNNMPDSLRDADTGQLLQERCDALDEAVSELQNVDISVEEPEESDEQDGDEKIEERLDEIRSELTDALGNISCS